MDNTLVLSPDTLAAIVRQIEQLREEKSQTGERVIVCIAGGSCTGKSTQVSQQVAAGLPGSVQVIAQDNFQRGKLDGEPDPVYRWDAPASYGVPESTELLQKLKRGEPACIPQYSFREGRRIGETILPPTDVVLFEGLYAGYDTLRTVADLLIYTEAPLYARMIRRLLRNMYERYTGNPSLILKSFLTGGVLKAHRAEVVTQRAQADSILRIPFRLGESIARFNLPPLPHPTEDFNQLFKFELEDAGSFRITRTQSGTLYFGLFHQSVLYLHFPVDEETCHYLRSTDLFAL